MDTSVKSLNKWANAHTNFWFDFMRIALGIFLIYKGYSFITNTAEFDGIIAPTKLYTGGMISFHYIATAHLMGGIMLVFGLLTRWVIISQLPILIGAILVNFFGMMNVNNLILAIITFGVCIFFLFYGSGKHSADYFFKMEK